MRDQRWLKIIIPTLNTSLVIAEREANSWFELVVMSSRRRRQMELTTWNNWIGGGHSPCENLSASTSSSQFQCFVVILMDHIDRNVSYSMPCCEEVVESKSSDWIVGSSTKNPVVVVDCKSVIRDNDSRWVLGVPSFATTYRRAPGDALVEAVQTELNWRWFIIIIMCGGAGRVFLSFASPISPFSGLHF